MHPFAAGRSRRFLLAICLLIAAAITLLAAGSTGLAADPTMFEGARAMGALEAITVQAGRKPRFLGLEITAERLTAEIQDPDDPSRIVTWRVSQAGILRSLLGTNAIRGRSVEPTLPAGSLAENLFDLDPADLARLPQLAEAALARARLQEPGAVVRMELRRQLRILPTTGVGPPRWEIKVKGNGEQAEIYADLSGKITLADLRETLRFQHLDLRAGGPDLDELVKQIDAATKDKWGIRYVEVEPKSIEFEASLATAPGAQPVTRFTAGFDGIQTTTFGVPQLSLPGSEPTDIFSLSEVDWQLLPELQKRARDSTGIQDGKIISVVLLKPKREFGDSGIEWRILVEDKNAPVFWTPNSPSARRGTAVFDGKSALLRAVFPPGEGPKADLLDPPVLDKALAAMMAWIGPDIKAAEMEVSDDEIALTAMDPKNPNALAVFTYRDQQVKRDTGARTMVANSMGTGPAALFDLASLEPAISGPLAALERETVSRLAIKNGRVIRLTFSKDKVFRPGNDKVLIEIRVAGDGPDHQWINYDLSGNVVGNEDTVKSGLRVVRPVSHRDEEDCSSPSKPATIIAACTRLIESGQFVGHDLAALHYNRGIAHKSNNNVDQALSDYSEAIRLDSNYAHAYLNRGALLASKSEFDRAIADLGAAIRLDPTDKRGYKIRGAVYKLKRDWDRAIADYGEAIRLDPNEIDVIHARGIAYYSKQDFDRAIADFTEVIRQEPKAAGAFTLRGRCHQEKGDFERAVADFTEAIRLTPRDPEPYIDRASSYRDAGDLDRAIAGYTEALGIDPKSLIAYRDRGWSYRGKGEFDRAIADYDRALQLDPKNAPILFARGFTAYLKGAPAKALADISQANALDPAEPYAALWLGILGQRSGLAGQMAKATAKVDMTSWPAPVIKLFLGELTVEALRAAAADPDPKTRSGQVCEVNFYTGEIARRGGAKTEAARLFTLAAQECPATWIELEAANAELKALAANP